MAKLTSNILAQASAALLLAACLNPSSADKSSEVMGERSTPRAGVRGDPEEGARIGESWCSSCHTVSLRSPASDVGPTWSSIAMDVSKTDEYLSTYLAAPHWPMENIALSRQEIADLVAYIRTLEVR